MQATYHIKQSFVQYNLLNKTGDLFQQFAQNKSLTYGRTCRWMNKSTRKSTIRVQGNIEAKHEKKVTTENRHLNHQTIRNKSNYVGHRVTNKQQSLQSSDTLTY